VGDEVRVKQCHIGRLWLAARIKFTNFAIGFAIDFDDTIWATVCIGPIHLDLAYGVRQPCWRG